MKIGARNILYTTTSVTLLILAIVYYSLQIGSHISERYTPMLDATVNIKLEATTAHLWFDEAISGDKNIKIETIWAHLDQSEWYAQTMLEESINNKSTGLTINATDLHIQIEETLNNLHQLRKIAEKQWAALAISGIGSAIDKQHDDAFLTFIISANNIEVIIKKAIAIDSQKFKHSQQLLIILIIILGIVVGALLLHNNIKKFQNISINKAIEARLYKSQNQLLNVINGAKLGYWDWYYKTGEHQVNDEWLSMLGLTRQDITNHMDDWKKLIHPQDKEFMSHIVQEHIQSGKSFIAEFRMRHANGSWVWIQGAGSVAEYDKDTQEPIRLCGTHQDITERKKNEEKMLLASKLLNESQRIGQLGGWKLDIKTGDLFWTDETYRIHDTSPEEFNPTVDAGVDYFLPESKEIISKALEQAIQQGVGYDLELETYTTKGRKIHVRTTCTVTQEKGVAVSLAGIFQDITHQKTTQRKLEENNLDLATANNELKLAASVFRHAGESIVITDTTGTIIDVNEAFSTTTGYSREEAIGKNPRILNSGRQSTLFYTHMWQALEEKGHWCGELWNRRKDGEVYAEIKTISAVYDANGVATHYVSLGNNITLIKEHQAQLEHIAHFDILTNLPNRSLLADRLSQAMSQCNRRKQSLAVVFLDLDGFKAVNDNYGHNVGDELLIALSTRMKEVLREGDSLARIGGDEFVAVLADLPTVEDCEPVLERLLMATSEPMTLGDIVLNISASLGVTFYPQDDVDPDLLMRHADQAMYIAKESGKNCYHLFDTAQDDAVKIQRESLEAIRIALDKQQFVLYYQPKVNMRTGFVTGMEALIRWQHPEKGLLSPMEFLPVIENNPMSIEIGEWVIDTALMQINQWQKMDLNLPINVSVNIAAVQLQQTGFTKKLTELLAKHPDVDPCNLELEILETSALDDVQHVSNIMNACMELGVKFALDDFGTGYSSLTYLRRLPANLIKIDQTFVRDMLHDDDDFAIVEGVIALAKSFKREVIAEGVETSEHGTSLLRLGCELAQGYGIARPMPASEFPTWVSGWKPDVNWKI